LEAFRHGYRHSRFTLFHNTPKELIVMFLRVRSGYLLLALAPVLMALLVPASAAGAEAAATSLQGFSQVCTLDGNYHEEGEWDVFDAVNDVATDCGGNVIAAGYTTNSWPDGQGGYVLGYRDFTVVKFAGKGKLSPQWVRKIDGTSHSSDEAMLVATDRQGGVIAAGYLVNNGPPGFYGGADIVVVKWDSCGREQWR
jgi:hypothetical protein